MKSQEITRLIAEADNGDNLEIKIENRMAMNDMEVDTIIVERVKTPDYVRICRVFRQPPMRTSNPTGRSHR